MVTDATPSSSASPSSAERDEFDRDIKQKNLLGYWMIPSRSNGYREPKAPYGAFKWDWQTLRNSLQGAIAYIPKEEAHRRFIGLQHPDLELGTTPHLMLGGQLLQAGEMAPPHRHTMDAVRFVVEGDGSACTVVEGEVFPMARGDLITTPNWSWHDHVSEAKQDTVWLDGAVAPLIVNFGVGFAEPHQEPRQAISAKGDWSRMQFGPLQPRTPKYSSTARRPPFRYPWEQTRRVLDQLAAEQGDAHDDVVLHFADPLTGGPTLMTLDCEMQLLRPHWSGKPHRHTHATIYHVVEGEGASTVGDKRIEWGPGDTFVVPIWARHAHENQSAKPAVLFSISDKPVMKALGFDREDLGVRN